VSAFTLLPLNIADMMASVLATMAVDPGLVIVKDTPPAPVCSGPAPAFAAMLRSNTVEPVKPAAAALHSIRRAPDGLFYIDAVVNGAPIRFLIDTGATMIVLTKEDAARAGVMPTAAAFDQSAKTAGGDTAMARIRLARLSVGQSIDFDVPAAVAQSNLGVSLLGASWITQLGSVTIAGDRMLLQ
jgi:aspartyl protease family protein